MGADKDIRFQIPVEYAIALEVARGNDGLILPNKAGKDSAKDFTIFVPIRYEVKCDYRSKETRNVFLEVWNCRLNKPSGLTASKADWWIHYTPGDAVFYRFNPKRMLNWLETKSGLKKIEGAGDANSNGYILALAVMEKLEFVSTRPFMG